MREVASATNALIDAWDPAKGNFGRTFSEPDNAVYANEGAAFNALGYALYYVEQEVKDLKLAIPLGLSLDCPSTTCPDRVEAPYALASSENIRHNLSAFRVIFQGCGEGNEGLGLDDALRAKGPAGESLVTRMLQALASAEREAQALDLPIEVALAEQPARVTALYNAVKRLSDLLKTELITLLDIQPPMSAEGDND
jgi:predicted lipoprotein